jgi:glycosyltransferase involved in cell wall biosynthesis
VRIINNSKSIFEGDKFEVALLGYGNQGKIQIDQFVVYNVKRGKAYFQKIFYFIFRGFYFCNLLKTVESRGDVLVYYGTSLRILVPLWVYSKINRNKLIVDVVEWYDYSHLPFGRYGPFAWDVHLSMTWLIPKCDGVIAISTFLEDHFKGKGLKTLRVPIIIDAAEQNVPNSTVSAMSESTLNLVYAGFPGKKDLLKSIIDAIQILNEEVTKIKLHILGMDRSSLIKYYGSIPSSAILPHGKKPRYEVNRFLESADFSVLFRPKERYAMAGFPTKFVESLNRGLPVIANLTSDIGLYLNDGYNGFVANGHDLTDIINVLSRALEVDKQTLKIMKRNARESALRHFRFQSYTSSLNDFFLEVLQDS